MRNLVNIIYYIALIVYGGAFLFAFGQFVVYNGLGDFFDYIKVEDPEVNIEIDSVMEKKTIFYAYLVEDIRYKSKQTIYIEKIPKYEFHETNIFYNSKLPSFSYIGKKELKLRSPTSGMIISGVLFIFTFLVYKFSNIDKWVGVYTKHEYKKDD